MPTGPDYHSEIQNWDHVERVSFVGRLGQYTFTGGTNALFVPVVAQARTEGWGSDGTMPEQSVTSAAVDPALLHWTIGPAIDDTVPRFIGRFQVNMKVSVVALGSTFGASGFEPAATLEPNKLIMCVTNLKNTTETGAAIQFVVCGATPDPAYSTVHEVHSAQSPPAGMHVAYVDVPGYDTTNDLEITIAVWRDHFEVLVGVVGNGELGSALMPHEMPEDCVTQTLDARTIESFDPMHPATWDGAGDSTPTRLPEQPVFRMDPAAISLTTSDALPDSVVFEGLFGHLTGDDMTASDTVFYAENGEVVEAHTVVGPQAEAGTYTRTLQYWYHPQVAAGVANQTITVTVPEGAENISGSQTMANQNNPGSYTGTGASLQTLMGQYAGITGNVVIDGERDWMRTNDNTNTEADNSVWQTLTQDPLDTHLQLSSNYLYEMDITADLNADQAVADERTGSLVSHYTYCIPVYVNMLNRHFSAFRSETNTGGELDAGGDAQLAPLEFKTGMLTKSASFMRDVLLGGRGASLASFGQYGGTQSIPNEDVAFHDTHCTKGDNNTDDGARKLQLMSGPESRPAYYSTTGMIALDTDQHKRWGLEFALLSLQIVTSAIFGRIGGSYKVDGRTVYGLGSDEADGVNRLWVEMAIEAFESRTGTLITPHTYGTSNFPHNAAYETSPSPKQLFNDPLHLISPMTDELLRDDTSFLERPDKSLADACAYHYATENAGGAAKVWPRSICEQIVRRATLDRAQYSQRVLAADPGASNVGTADSTGQTGDRYHSLWMKADELHLYFVIKATTVAEDVIRGPNIYGAHYFSPGENAVIGPITATMPLSNNGHGPNLGNTNYTNFATTDNDEATVSAVNQALENVTTAATNPLASAADHQLAKRMQGIVLRVKLQVVADPASMHINAQNFTGPGIAELAELRLLTSLELASSWSSSFDAGSGNNCGDAVQALRPTGTGTEDFITTPRTLAEVLCAIGVNQGATGGTIEVTDEDGDPLRKKVTIDFTPGDSAFAAEAEWVALGVFRDHHKFDPSGSSDYYNQNCPQIHLQVNSDNTEASISFVVMAHPD